MILLIGVKRWYLPLNVKFTYSLLQSYEMQLNWGGIAAYNNLGRIVAFSKWEELTFGMDCRFKLLSTITISARTIPATTQAHVSRIAE